MMFTEKHDLMRCDIREHKDNYTLDIDMPGYQKEDLRAYVKNGYLTVRAMKIKESKDEKKKYLRRERYHGEMTRSFYVGKELKQEDIKASYQKGVLTVTIPKADEKKVEKQGQILIA